MAKIKKWVIVAVVLVVVLAGSYAAYAAWIFSSFQKTFDMLYEAPDGHYPEEVYEYLAISDSEISTLNYNILSNDGGTVVKNEWRQIFVTHQFFSAKVSYIVDYKTTWLQEGEVYSPEDGGVGLVGVPYEVELSLQNGKWVIVGVERNGNYTEF